MEMRPPDTSGRHRLLGLRPVVPRSANIADPTRTAISNANQLVSG